MLSAMSGLDKGIQLLSNVNIYVAGVLLVLTLILGPTLFIMNNFTNSFGDYLQNIIQMSFQTAPDAPDARKWIDSWTIFIGLGGFLGLRSLGFLLPEFRAVERFANSCSVSSCCPL